MRARWLAIGMAVLLAACSSRPDAPGGAPVVAGTAAAPDGQFGRAGGGEIGRSQLGGGSQQELAAGVGDRVFFAYDRSDISSEGRQVLERQAQWLRGYPNVSLTIEGHADERGTREYNLSLGERRAEAVKNLLVALGVPAARLSTISYGKERPEVPHSDEQSYAQNRRAVTVVN